MSMSTANLLALSRLLKSSGFIPDGWDVDNLSELEGRAEAGKLRFHTLHTSTPNCYTSFGVYLCDAGYLSEMQKNLYSLTNPQRAISYVLEYKAFVLSRIIDNWEGLDKTTRIETNFNAAVKALGVALSFPDAAYAFRKSGKTLLGEIRHAESMDYLETKGNIIQFTSNVAHCRVQLTLSGDGTIEDQLNELATELEKEVMELNSMVES